MRMVFWMGLDDWGVGVGGGVWGGWVLPMYGRTASSTGERASDA